MFAIYYRPIKITLLHIPICFHSKNFKPFSTLKIKCNYFGRLLLIFTFGYINAYIDIDNSPSYHITFRLLNVHFFNVNVKNHKPYLFTVLQLFQQSVFQFVCSVNLRYPFSKTLTGFDNNNRDWIQLPPLANNFKSLGHYFTKVFKYY